jgi:hypothetical protein
MATPILPNSIPDFCEGNPFAGQAGVRFPAAKSVWASDNEAMAMTEQEWLECTDPQAILKLVGYKVSERKLRLCSCAFIRRVIHVVTDPRSRLAVEVAERFADAEEPESAIQLLRASIDDDRKAGRLPDWENFLVRDCLSESAESGASAAAWNTAQLPVGDLTQAWECKKIGDPAVAATVRDILGNPFRPVTVNPAWRTANVTALAQAIYEDRAFDPPAHPRRRPRRRWLR